MDTRTPVVARGFAPAELVMLAVAGAWSLWVLLASSQAGVARSEAVGYVAFPLVLCAGMGVGHLCARRPQGRLVPASLVVVALAILFRVDFYANAQAAVGVQMVALAGLLLSVRTPETRVPPDSLAGTASVALAATAGVLGVLLASRSQAASACVVLVAVVVAGSIVRRDGSPRRGVIALGVGGVVAAMVAVLVLGSLGVWPEQLREATSLSSARHGLWSEALELWREHPLTGAGPGSFHEYSETSHAAAHLYAAHSSILQVGSELGLVGAVLLLAVLVAGAVVAGQGKRAQAQIGVTAWCALAVHSMIDHLYEFPIVVLLAGVVVGWSGARHRAAPVARSEAANASRHDLA